MSLYLGGGNGVSGLREMAFDHMNTEARMGPYMVDDSLTNTSLVPLFPKQGVFG